MDGPIARGKGTVAGGAGVGGTQEAKAMKGISQPVHKDRFPQ